MYILKYSAAFLTSVLFKVWGNSRGKYSFILPTNPCPLKHFPPLCSPIAFLQQHTVHMKKEILIQKIRSFCPVSGVCNKAMTKPLQKLDLNKKGKARTKFRNNTGNRARCTDSLVLLRPIAKHSTCISILSLNRAVMVKIQPED